MNNIVNIFFSPTSNTKIILDSIAQGIGVEGKLDSIDLTLPQAREQKHCLSCDDLAIVGVPVYGGRVPRFLNPAIKNISGNGAKAIAIVSYGNRDYEDALLELTNLLNEQGFDVIAAGAFVGEHSITENLATNRPDQNDIQIAIDFGKQIASKKHEGKLTVKGNFPYIEKENKMPEMGPETKVGCIQCKVCANTCPTGAISKDDCRIVAIEKCIKCCSCIRKCPIDVKTFSHPALKKMQEMLTQNFGQMRKEPEVFLSE